MQELTFCANIWFVRYFYACEDDIEILRKKLRNRDHRRALISCSQSLPKFITRNYGNLIEILDI